MDYYWLWTWTKANWTIWGSFKERWKKCNWSVLGENFFVEWNLFCGFTCEFGILCLRILVIMRLQNNILQILTKMHLSRFYKRLTHAVVFSFKWLLLFMSESKRTFGTISVSLSKLSPSPLTVIRSSMSIVNATLLCHL